MLINTSVVGICGAITTGKSTLAKEIRKETGFEIVSEDIFGPWNPNIITNIDSHKHPKCIFEHCYLYQKLDLFSQSYDLTLMYLLLVEESLLLRNFNDRLAVSKRGDFSKMNPVEHEILILNEFNECVRKPYSNVVCKTLTIKDIPDYSIAREQILKDIRDFAL